MNTTGIPPFPATFDGPAWRHLRERAGEVVDLTAQSRATRAELERSRGVDLRDARAAQTAAHAAAIRAGSPDVPTIEADHLATIAVVEARARALGQAVRSAEAELEGAASQAGLRSDVRTLTAKRTAAAIAELERLRSTIAELDELRALVWWLEHPGRPAPVAPRTVPGLSRGSSPAYTVDQALAALADVLGSAPAPAPVVELAEVDAD